MNQIVDILGISEDILLEDVEKLRKNQFILMSPQRKEGKLVKVYEILSKNINEIDKTETEGFNNTNFGELKSEVEILSLIDNIMKEIQDSQLGQLKKDTIIGKLSKIKDKLKI